jgi:hypothetical protein
LIGALTQAANALAVIAPDLKTGSGKALEGAVLFHVALGCENGFNTVVARDHRGRRLRGHFILRGGPGHLSDPRAAGPAPSYFAVTISGSEFELHNSLEFTGSSGEDHEVDVSAVWADDARDARGSGRRILRGPPVLGVELKELKVGSDLDKNVVRAFFGVIVDFIPTWSIRWMALGGSAGFQREFSQALRPSQQFWLLTTARLSEPSQRFARAQDINVQDELDLTRLRDATAKMGGYLHARGTFGR